MNQRLASLTRLIKNGKKRQQFIISQTYKNNFIPTNYKGNTTINYQPEQVHRQISSL